VALGPRGTRAGLRRAAASILKAGLAACDPAPLVAAELRRAEVRCDGRLLMIAAGKAVVLLAGAQKR